MPQHKSAKKRVKTNLKRQVRNRAGRSTLRSDLKTIHEEENKEQAVKNMQSTLDRAANSGLVHKNKAARLKSRFARKS